MNSRDFKAGLLGVVGALVLGAAVPAVVSAQDDARKMPGAPKIGEAQAAYGKMKAAAAQAETRINKSEADQAAMAAAARAGSVGRAKALLIKNGFTPQQLEGVPIRFEHSGGGGGGGGGGSAERIKSVEIKVSCCPLEITIIIRF